MTVAEQTIIEPVIRNVTNMFKPKSAFASLISLAGVCESAYFLRRNAEYPNTKFGVTVVANKETASTALPPGILKENPSVTKSPISGPDVKAVNTNAKTIINIKT